MSDQWYDRRSAARDISRICRGNIYRDELTPIVDKPPILPSVEDDTELEIMFGNDCKLAYGVNDFDPPDPAMLGHIPNMIDMVREHDSDNMPSQTPPPNDDDFYILEISRLNPEVPAFQSNIANMADKVEGINKVNLQKEFKKENKQIPANKSSKKDQLQPQPMSMPKMNDETQKYSEHFHNIEIKKSSKLDLTNITQEEAEELKNKLKTEINQQHDNTCSVYKKKLNRNVAIANLLKLHSVKPLEATSSKKAPAITLMSPDYFISTHSTNVHDSRKTADRIEEPKKQPCVKNKYIYGMENELEKENRMDRSEKVTKVDSNTKEPALEDECDNISQKTPEQPSSVLLQRSIDRVNEWFEVTDDTKVAKVVSSTSKTPIAKTSTTDAKPGFVLGGPITFKKKCSSPKNVDDRNSSSPIRGSSPMRPRPKQFKPSQFSNQLLKKYNEQSEKTIQQTEDMWTRVQRQMREKDYEKKKKLLQESDSSPNSH